MKVLFLTDNFPPEVNAPAVRTHFHCREWVNAGCEVTVVTCVPNFPAGVPFEGYRNRMWQEESVDGIRVIRVWTFMAPNRGFALRILDYLSYAAGAFLAGLRQDFDVIVATSPQFFTACSGAALSLAKRKPWVFELRDFWPESIVSTGAMKSGFLVRLLERMEMRLYRSAALVVPVTHSFKRQLIDRGISDGKIRVITNGVNRAEWEKRKVREPSASAPRFTVGYLGTHGMAHGLDTLLQAAEHLTDHPVDFVLVGDGAERQRLIEEAKRLAIPNVTFGEPVSRDRVPSVLRSFDAAVIPLRDSPTFSSVLPSKIFEAAAAGVPILLGVRGEAEALVTRYNAGLCFPPEDTVGLADSICRLLNEPLLCAELSAGGSRLAEDFDRVTLARRMLNELRSVVDRE